MSFLIAIVGNSLGLLAAVWALPQIWPGSIEWRGGIGYLLIAGAVIGIINGVVKPILKLLSLPLIIFTAGLFGLFLNIGLVWVTDLLLDGLTIHGFLPLLATTVILAIVHIVI